MVPSTNKRGTMNTYHDLIKKAKYIETSYGHGAFGEGEVYHDERVSCEKLIDATYHECLEIVNERLREIRLDSNVDVANARREVLLKVKSDIIQRIERR